MDWSYWIRITGLELLDSNYRTGTIGSHLLSELEALDWNNWIGTTGLELLDWNHWIGTTGLKLLD